MNDDTISRQAAIDALRMDISKIPFARAREYVREAIDAIYNRLEGLPSEQSEQSEMIKDIRKWINSGNRGNADYFIVDKIEEIINKYER